jgi:tetratricopeptide (TPR) repeat protein
MLALGNLELRAGKLQSARAIAKALQQAHPDAGAGYLLRGDVLMAEHRAKEAVSAYGAAFSRAPNDRLAIKLGQARSEVGDTSGAYDTLKTWLASHPEDRGVRLVLAATYDRAGRKGLAIDEYNRALEQWPTDVLALNNLAWLYYEQADSRALGTANQAYQLAPERPEVLETYGWLLIQHGHMARGLALLEKANQQTRNDRDIHDRRGADRVNARDRTRTPKETDVLLESGLIAFRSSGFLAQHQP